MNDKKRKHVRFSYPIIIPSKEICSNSYKTTPSSLLEPPFLKGLNSRRQLYLKDMMKLYDTKPRWKEMEKLYISKLVNKYLLGYISKDSILPYLSVMSQYAKKGPTKYKVRKSNFEKKSTPSSKVSSLTNSKPSQLCFVIKHYH
ncbi:protein FAM216B [Macrotis lagotis]|uniref:protein FAM216B n=1 Tax=Macrotis lagotis TaxID=92651 RepID=UPI003D699440